MSHRIIQKINQNQWKEISIEGNELVCYEYEQDPTQPKIWLDGHQYRFSKNLVSVQRIGSKKVVEIFNDMEE